MDSFTMISEQWSRVVAPAVTGVEAGVCPLNRARGVDAHAQASLPTAGTARRTGMATGHRPWSPPIT
jgi:hypothetical protein